MNILLLGSGGRECALAKKLSESRRCEKLFIAPGNGGTSRYGVNVALSPLDFKAIEDFVAINDIEMIVVGNEDPLVAGIYDYFKQHPVLVVGPSGEGARLEGSKDYAKRFMERHDIPTAAYRSFTAETVEEGCRFLESLKPPYVLKADGLAAGKGVLIIPTLDEACAALREMLDGKFGASSATVVIEEFLSGIECSVFVVTDGAGGYRILPEAKDYKRIGEGDTGLNTGGMGAVSPVPFADAEFMRKVEERIIRPTVEGLAEEGIVYRGFIFLGLIKVEGNEPMVIEYNVRMGDPETEVVMPRLKSDLVDLLEAAARGNLGNVPAEHDPRAAVTVMAVSGGYPEAYAKGYEISGNLTPENSVVFHAGTTETPDGRVLTSGGRVLAVTSMADDARAARALSYKALEDIKFKDMYFRRDIGKDILD
ncbi:MAG: phosphoribosylamine--glycine ligase [Muribaculaceae bacterium]|nr:phosphoribosylamine--glycine ligase [Muribaculaceae bacterium]